MEYELVIFDHKDLQTALIKGYFFYELAPKVINDIFSGETSDLDLSLVFQIQKKNLNLNPCSMLHDCLTFLPLIYVICKQSRFLALHISW